MTVKTHTVGLMSGTSLDGIDAVVVDFGRDCPRLVGHYHGEFPDDLRQELFALCRPGDNEIDRMGEASVRLARVYARTVDELLNTADIGRKEIAAIGVHGQTVRHRPEAGWTLQLNNPALIAELTGIDVVADFRSRDLAAGGQGAPLVPAFHREVFLGDVARSIVNIGGISNLTYLPAKRSWGTVCGFDCGPGNILLDAWCRRHLRRDFDANGSWGATGTVDGALLEALLGEPYFARRPPKSTGRELFNLDWLEAKLSGQSPVDVQATLMALTARSIVDAVKTWAAPTREIYLCGGGALNGALVRRIAEEAGSGISVRSTALLGVDPMHVEAMAFAWLAWAFVNRRTGNLPEVTAATGARILGALYPH